MGAFFEQQDVFKPLWVGRQVMGSFSAYMIQIHADSRLGRRASNDIPGIPASQEFCSESRTKDPGAPQSQSDSPILIA